MVAALFLPTIYQLPIIIELVIVPYHNLSTFKNDLGDLLQLSIGLLAHHIPDLDILKIGFSSLFNNFSFIFVVTLRTFEIENLHTLI